MNDSWRRHSTVHFIGFSKAALAISVLLFACAPEPDGSVEPMTVNYSTPAGLIEELNRLAAGPCPLACQMAIAGMYSSRFLRALREATTPGDISDEALQIATNALFGQAFDRGQLESMSDQEYFARQMWHAESSAPPDLLLRHYQIDSEETRNASEVRLFVTRSGMKADADYQEEETIDLILEQGKWRIASRH